MHAVRICRKEVFHGLTHQGLVSPAVLHVGHRETVTHDDKLDTTSRGCGRALQFHHFAVGVVAQRLRGLLAHRQCVRHAVRREVYRRRAVGAGKRLGRFRVAHGDVPRTAGRYAVIDALARVLLVSVYVVGVGVDFNTGYGVRRRYRYSPGRAGVAQVGLPAANHRINAGYPAAQHRDGDEVVVAAGGVEEIPRLAGGDRNIAPACAESRRHLGQRHP